MSSSDWNTYTPAKRVTPIWGKLLIGCGIALLLIIGSCVSFTYWATHSGSDAIRGFVSERFNQASEKPWNEMVSVLDALKTDESATKLYRDNQGLAVDYPTEAEFLKTAATWQTKVIDLPSTPPNFGDPAKGDFEFSKNIAARVSIFETRYRMPNNTNIYLRWEDDKLVKVDVW
jgi:hypothetical protein